MNQRPTIGEIFQKDYKIPLNEIDILLSAVLHCDRITIYSYPEYKLSNQAWQKLQNLIKQREQGLPIAYLTGQKEFYGLNFFVTPAVLIPRPDTELLVETAINLAPKKAVVADIGTGSGNIAIALKYNRPDCIVLASDISEAALKIAKKNAKRLQTPVKFYQGNVLAALPKKNYRSLNLICFNAPYLTKAEAAKANLKFEPKLALTAKGQPTSLIEKLLKTANNYLKPHGLLLLEIGYRQAKTVSALCLKYFPKAQIEVKKDLGGFDRLIICRI